MQYVKDVLSTNFEIFGMIQPGIAPLANTLPTRAMEHHLCECNFDSDEQ